MGTISNIAIPVIIIGILLILAFLWNVYMNFCNKHELSRLHSDNISITYMYNSALNVRANDLRLVHAEGDGNSEVEFDKAVSKIVVSDYSEIKIDG